MDDLVTLEAYADEIRALIRNDRNDEAIAICKHILHYYPKHLDSYRQMGEALLEKDELDPAVDLFRRVLSADPENVIAYVGLATAFEKQHLIDEAVWHLERADEIEPGNFEIHKELLRLYSDAGKPRQRLKLSPGGLARLYDQEGLYPQAIQELRGIVDASPSRYDARTALAETLWHAGRIHESAEIAQNILTSLPYCLKANLILGTAWKESGLVDYETFLNRAQELDPCHKMAPRLLGAHSPLSVTNVSLPRYVPGAAPSATPRSFPAPATLTTTEPTKRLAEEPETPSTDLSAETFTTAIEPPVSPTLESESEPTFKPNLPGTNLPPWLVSQFPESNESASPTQLLPSTTVAPSEPDSAATEPTEDELPPWLQGESPTQPIESTAAESPESAIEQLPAWFQNSSGEDGTVLSAEEQAQSGEPTSAEDMPEWLRTLQAQSAPTGETEPVVPEEPEATDEYVLPSFLTPATERTQATEQPAAQDLPALSAPEREPAAKQPAQDVPAIVSQPAPAIEEYASIDQTLEKRSEGTAEPTAIPTIEEYTPVDQAVEKQPEGTAEPTAIPTIEEYTPVDQAVEKRPEGTAEPATVPPILVEMPTASSPPSESTPQLVPGMPAAVPPIKSKRQPKGYTHLVLAREQRDGGRTDDALAEYDYIVLHAPRLVNEVIADLETLIARADAPLEAHRILGDAYTRADRLSEALQRYQYVLERTSDS